MRQIQLITAIVAGLWALAPVGRATAQRPAGLDAVCAVQVVAARRAADSGHFAAAVARMDSCLTRWAGGPAADAHTAAWRQTRQAYALVGQRAPAPLAAPYWLHAPPGMTAADLTHPVTLVEFTWTGCPECEKGYPTLRTLEAQYRARGVQVIFLTYLFGSTPERDSATVEQELAYDTHFWGDAQPLPFPIGVLPRPARNRYPELFNTYAVIGAPTYYLLDRHGVIRYYQSGHRADLSARLTTVIEALLHAA
jgi:thiol-disulfide isomerase/thioredoxin